MSQNVPSYTLSKFLKRTVPCRPGLGTSASERRVEEAGLHLNTPLPPVFAPRSSLKRPLDPCSISTGVPPTSNATQTSNSPQTYKASLYTFIYIFKSLY